MKRNALLFVLSILLNPFWIYGAKESVSQGQALSIATRFINNNALPSSVYQVVDQAIFVKDGKKLVAYLFEIQPSGFVVVSAYHQDQPVLAYSLENNFAKPGSEDEAIAFGLIQSIGRNYQIEQKESQRAAKHVDQFEVGPFVQSLWGQVNCHDNNGNLVNVSNYYTPSHYAPGCVAISMTTLMHHYRWPINGTGSHIYTDKWGSSKGIYSADFEDTYYSWVNMLERYKNKPSTDWEREAEGLLVYQSAVALEMDFEYNGSTSNVNRIPAAGKNYFRFSSLKRQFGSPVFWQLLDSNMMHEIPVVLAISANNGAGHSIVCDGLRIEEDGTFYYHLNNGWWGSSNGWYRLREGSLAGGYDDITDGIFYFLPIPALSIPILSQNSNIISLQWQYPENIEADAFEVQQSIDNSSWTTISNDIQDTALDVEVDLIYSYKFRVRAKAKGRWSNDSWSNEEQMGYVGIDDEIELNQVKIGPNPVTNNLFIQIPKTVQNPMNVKVMNVNGKLIHQAVYNGKATIELNAQDWKPGIYLLNVSNDQHARTFKIVRK